jgi:hypothetical protein
MMGPRNYAKNFLTLVFWWGLAAGVLMYAFKSCVDKRDAKQTAIQLTDSSVYWRDMYNREHVTRKIVQADRDLVRQLYPKLLDSVARLLKVRPRQVKSVAGVVATVHDTIYTPFPVHDTLLAQQGDICFSYRDDWMGVQGCADSSGYVQLIYSVDVPVSLATYYRRRWFLGRKRWYVDGSSDNPNVRLSGLSKIQIR